MMDKVTHMGQTKGSHQVSSSSNMERLYQVEHSTVLESQTQVHLQCVESKRASILEGQLGGQNYVNTSNVLKSVDNTHDDITQSAMDSQTTKAPFYHSDSVLIFQ